MGSEVKNTRMRWDVQLQATVLHYNPIQTGRDQATSITDVFELIQYIAQVLQPAQGRIDINHRR